MTIKEIGTVRASGGRSRKVRWDDKTGEVYVTDGGFISGYNSTGVKVKSAAAALDYAKEWLEADKKR